MSKVLPKGQTSLLSFFQQQQKRGGDGGEAATTTTTTTTAGTRTPKTIQRKSTRVTPEESSSSTSHHHPVPAQDLSELLLSQKASIRRRQVAVPASPLREDAEETSSTSNMINHATTDSDHHHHHQLSDYELLRLRNIQRNEARLAALGLQPSSFSSSSTTTSTTKRCPVRPKRRAPAPSTAAATRSLSTRRSTRQRRSSTTTVVNSTSTAVDPAGAALTTSGTATTTTEDPSTHFPPVEPEISYQVSPLMQYSMVRTPCRATNTTTSSTTTNTTSWTSLAPLAQRLNPGMGAVYSMHFTQNQPWLVGAGKAGCIALWDVTSSRTAGAAKHCDRSTSDNIVVDPLWTWKAHAGRWIAEARFLTSTTTTGSSSHQQEHHLVTAGNDGTVCLWDLTSRQRGPAGGGLPRLLAQSNKHNLHSSGIFAMDTIKQGQGEYRIATASKDKTIRVSRIGSSSSSPQWNEWTSHHHTRKVGDVRFATLGGNDDNQHSTLLASAGDDGIVAIHDTRTHRIVGELKQAHIRPHSVVWRPPQEGQSQSSPSQHLLTAGYDDPTLKLWDLRKLGGTTPLAVLEGHVPAAGATTTTTRSQRIHRPVFYGAGGQYVLTGGQNSRALSIYHISPSHQVTLQSRGVLPEDCGDAACLAVMDDEESSSSSRSSRSPPQKVALSTERAEILLLEPSSTAAAS